MQFLNPLKGIVAALSFAILATAAPTAADGVSTLTTRGSCHGPDNRGCWSDGYSIDTNYETSAPSGTTRTFDFVITEEDNWTGPDGVVKEKVMLINGGLPGPTIEADWGDTIVINVHNNLQYNGTSIHWHGLRQFGSNIMDGVNGVTECPLAPGKTKTYTWTADQYGTSWYHSHFSAQYGNGVYGAIVIHGPASCNYDVDLGTLMISDYYYNTSDNLVYYTRTYPAPPESDNILFNGHNINPKNPALGAYENMKLTPGKKHRLRLINPSVENTFQVSMVGHNFTVFATDFVPVEPLVTDNLFIAVGQRYDVMIEATQPVNSYWLNVSFSTTALCGTSANAHPAMIMTYEGSTCTIPTDPGTPPPDSLCQDWTEYSPVVSWTAPQDKFEASISNTLDIALLTSPVVKWAVNGSSADVEWDKPAVQYVLDGNTSYPEGANIITVNEPDAWTFWLIQNTAVVPHPIHLHGHDFLVLGHSAAATDLYTPETDFGQGDLAKLNFNNPTRRDVTMLPGNGWVVLAFPADNPGAWLMHCHIAWHVSGGLAVTFMERPADQMASFDDAAQKEFQQQCADWDAAYASSPFKKIDSGI